VISRQVRVQLVLFALLGLLFMGLAGFQYVGFDKVINRPFKVTAYFAKSGGIFPNAEVTYRGVGVGKVGALKLTKDGVAAELMIDKGKQVPRDTDAVVADLSFVGEQYVDLQPLSAAGPMLREGDTIPLEHTRTPLSDSDFLVGLDKLVNSVPREDLRVVVDELGKATDNLGPTLTALVDRGNHLTKTLSDNLPQQLQLIQQSKQVLATANYTSGAFKDSGRRLASVVQQLRDSNPDITATFTHGVYSAQQIDALLKENEGKLPSLLNNLITLGQIQDLRLPAIKQLLLVYPEDIRNGFYNAPGDGTSHFGLNFDQAVPVCTSGYEATKRRSGEATPSNVPANTGAFCNLPTNSPTEVKGSRNAPRPPGDTTDPALKPGGAAAASTDGSTGDLSGNSVARAVGYDPLNQVVGAPDGSSYILKPVNANAFVYPGEGWKELYLGPVSGF